MLLLVTSGLNDEKAALLFLSSEKGLKENNLKPIARIIASNSWC